VYTRKSIYLGEKKIINVPDKEENLTGRKSTQSCLDVREVGVQFTSQRPSFWKRGKAWREKRWGSTVLPTKEGGQREKKTGKRVDSEGRRDDLYLNLYW